MLAGFLSKGQNRRSAALLVGSGSLLALANVQVLGWKTTVAVTVGLSALALSSIAWNDLQERKIQRVFAEGRALVASQGLVSQDTRYDDGGPVSHAVSRPGFTIISGGDSFLSKRIKVQIAGYRIADSDSAYIPEVCYVLAERDAPWKEYRIVTLARQENRESLMLE